MHRAPAGHRLRHRQSARPCALCAARLNDADGPSGRRTCGGTRADFGARRRPERGDAVNRFFATILARAETGAMLSDADALALAECDDLPALMRVAAALRDAGRGNLVSYS